MGADGFLRQFESPDKLSSKESVFVPKEVMSIKKGFDVVDSKAPESSTNENLIQLTTTAGQWTMCCESVDDMLAWQLALEQARVSGQQQATNNMSQNGMPTYIAEAMNNSK